MEVVVLQMRHLQVGREDRYPERYRVAGVENPIAFERLENVAHRGGAPFYRVDLELAFRPRVSAHGPLQVLVNDLFVVHQHAVWHRVVVAYDGIHQLMHELVGVEAELVHRPRHHRLQDGRPRHAVVFREPGFESAGHSLCARHPAYAGWQVYYPLALSNCELPEEEERFARLGGDPVWVATTGVQVRQGRLQRRFRCHFLDEILDLERTEFVELFQYRSI